MSRAKLDPRSGAAATITPPISGDRLSTALQPAPVPAAALPGEPSLAFERVYEAHFDEVCRWARACGGMDSEREDIAQAARDRLPQRRVVFDHEQSHVAEPTDPG